MIDDDALTERVRAVLDREHPGCRVSGLRSLPGGVSSLTWAARLHDGQDARPIVVKTAPPGLPPVRNRDVLRQARVLDLLHRTGVLPVPGVLATDAALPPMFVMDLVAGQSYEPLLDVTSDPPAPAVVAARAEAAVRALAVLHRSEPESSCPEGEPVSPVREEIDRWARLLDTVDPQIAPGHADLFRELAERVPAALPATLVHGDYRLANMIFDGPRLAAVIDWEIWSIGDPRIDLAWMLMHTDPRHRFHAERSAGDLAAGTGMPDRAALLDWYLKENPVELPDLAWFEAACHYKTAATIAVFVKRNRRLPEPEPKLVVAAESLADVVARGREILR